MTEKQYIPISLFIIGLEVQQPARDIFGYTDASLLFLNSAKKFNIKESQDLLESGADIDMQDVKGMTALMYAARNGNIKMVAFLLANDASINIQDKFGFTATMHAVYFGRNAVAKLLKESGANLFLVDLEMRNAHDIAKMRRYKDLAAIFPEGITSESLRKGKDALERLKRNAECSKLPHGSPKQRRIIV